MNEEKFSWSETIKFGIIAALIVVPFRMWVAQPFIVSGSSMEPTFSSGDYLIVDELTYRFRQPAKGDVVIFRYPLNQSTYFIKRIVGLPGETVEYSGKKTSLKNDEYFMVGDNRNASSDSRTWGPVKENLIIGREFIRLWSSKKMNAIFASTKTRFAEIAP